VKEAFPRVDFDLVDSFFPRSQLTQSRDRKAISLIQRTVITINKRSYSLSTSKPEFYCPRKRFLLSKDFDFSGGED
jgi:hypothetical protein